MFQDEILDEIHKIREEHAKSFNYDLDAMFADWQKKQAESGKEVVNLSGKHSPPTHWDGQTRNSGENTQDTSRCSI